MKNEKWKIKKVLNTHNVTLSSNYLILNSNYLILNNYETLG